MLIGSVIGVALEVGIGYLVLMFGNDDILEWF